MEDDNMDKSMEKYDVTVVEYPAKRLVGLKVRTSMQHAAEDCPALWMTFGPRMGEVPAGEGGHRATTWTIL